MFKAIRSIFIPRPVMRNRSQLDKIEVAEEQVHPRVLLIIYNPTVPSQRGRRLVDVMGWNKPDDLVRQFIEDLRFASYGYCHYEIADRLEVDAFPIKIDGFTYSANAYHSAWQARQGFHQPDWADYDRIMGDFDVARRITNRSIDEVWLFAFPYAGFYESRMAGPGSFWCNAPPLDGYDQVGRRFVIMGFNYERGVGEMLESYGHRGESIMAHFFRDRRGADNLWERFTRYDLTHPGRAEVGNVHFAPNSQKDYDWGNLEKVSSHCDNWFDYPNMQGSPRMVNCAEWGNGDTRQHHLWWFRHFPHEIGERNGIFHNWWRYLLNPSLV